jgi:flagellin
MITLNTNATAYGIANVLNKTNSEIQQYQDILSTGKNKLSGADLTRVSQQKIEMSTLEIANRNINEGKGLVEVTLTGMSALQSIAAQMKDLATQATSGTLNATQRTQLQDSFAQLQTDFDEVISESELYGQNLIKNGGTDVKILTSDDPADLFTIAATDLSATGLSINSASIDLTDATKAAAAITALETAVNTIGKSEAKFSSQLTSMDWRKDLNIAKTEALQDSVQRTEDADVAQTTVKLTEAETRSQLATAMLARAAQQPAQLLQLLR